MLMVCALTLTESNVLILRATETSTTTKSADSSEEGTTGGTTTVVTTPAATAGDTTVSSAASGDTTASSAESGDATAPAAASGNPEASTAGSDQTTTPASSSDGTSTTNVAEGEKGTTDSTASDGTTPTQQPETPASGETNAGGTEGTSDTTTELAQDDTAAGREGEAAGKNAESLEGEDQTEGNGTTSEGDPASLLENNLVVNKSFSLKSSDLMLLGAGAQSSPATPEEVIGFQWIESNSKTYLVFQLPYNGSGSYDKDTFSDYKIIFVEIDENGSLKPAGETVEADSLDDLPKDTNEVTISSKSYLEYKVNITKYLSGLKSGKRYAFKVTNGDGTVSSLLSTQTKDASGKITTETPDGSNSYYIAPPKTKLGFPAGLKFAIKSDGIYATWNKVTGASEYLVQLFKTGEENAVLEVRTTETSWKVLTASVDPSELKTYKCKVTALAGADSGYEDSDTAACTYSGERLQTPGGRAWVGTVAVWDAVENADYYNVKLWKDKETNAKASVTVKAEEGTKYDFLSYLKNEKGAPSKYYFTVTALSAASSYYEASEVSEGKYYSYVKDKIKNLKWDYRETGNVTFNVVDYYGTYDLIFYKNVTSKDEEGKEVTKKEKFKTVSLGSLEERFKGITEAEDRIYKYEAASLLTETNSYWVGVKDTRTGTEVLSDKCAFTALSKDKKLTKPVIAKTAGSNSKIEWEPVNQGKNATEELKELTGNKTEISYEIKLYNTSGSTILTTTDCFYNLNDAIVRTGYTKVVVRAISGNLSKFGSSDWSNELTVAAESSVLSLQGNIGGGVTYRLEGKKDNMTLSIEGSGAIKDFENPTLATSTNAAPWADYAKQIKTLNISSGITKIGNYAFYNMTKISTVSLPEKLTRIGNYAFYGCTALSGKIVVPSGVTVIGKGAFGKDTKITYFLFEGLTEPSVEPLKKNGSTNAEASFTDKVKISYSPNAAWSLDSSNKWNGYTVDRTTATKPEKITLDNSVISLGTESSAYIGVSSVSPSYANSDVTWKSSNTGIVTVEERTDGKLPAAVINSKTKTGVVTITATSKSNSSVKATCIVTVATKTNIWTKSGNNYLYINGSGAAATGWNYVYLYGKKDIADNYAWQYFDETTGARLTGWQTIDNYRYYLNKTTGALTTGTVKIDGKWYSFCEANQTAGSETENPKYGYGALYGYGDLNDGWEAGYKRYFEPISGEAATGWKEIEVDGKNYWYYFDLNGWKQTGIQKINGRFYYLEDREDEVGDSKLIGAKRYAEDLVDGEVEVNGKYYAPASNTLKNESVRGALITGWNDAKTKYYLPATAERAAGLLNINGTYYYFNLSTGESVKGGTVTVTDKDGESFTVVLGNAGITGGGVNTYTMGNKKTVGRLTYYVYEKDVKTAKYRDIFSVGSKLYYLNDNNEFEKVTGAVCINDKYYFYDNCAKSARPRVYVKKLVVNGTEEYTETNSVADADFYYEYGERKSGWIKIDDKKYYFDKDEGKYSNGRYYIKKVWYNFDQYGALKTNDAAYEETGVSLKDLVTGAAYSNGFITYKTDGKIKTGYKYYTGDYDKKGNPKTAYAKGLWEVNGKVMFLSSKGVPQTGFKSTKVVNPATGKKVSRKFYFSPVTGERQTGKLTIGKKNYYLYTAADVTANPSLGLTEGQLASAVWIATASGSEEDSYNWLKTTGSNMVFTFKTFDDAAFQNLKNTGYNLRYINKDGTFKSGWLQITVKKKKYNFYFDSSNRNKMARSSRVVSGQYYVDAYGRKQ